MNIRKISQLSGMALLALTVTLLVMAIVYTLQNPHVMVNLASIGWNG